MMRALKTLGVLAVLVGLAGIGWADEAKGTIKSVDAGRHEVIFKGVVKDSTYELVKDAPVWLDGRKIELKDLAADDRALVVYEKRGDRMVGSSIRALRKASETIGTVADVLPDRKEITLKGTLKNTTYEMAKNATFWVDAKARAIADVRPGDEVLMTYEKHGDRYIANDVTVLKHPTNK